MGAGRRDSGSVVRITRVLLDRLTLAMLASAAALGAFDLTYYLIIEIATRSVCAIF